MFVELFFLSGHGRPYWLLLELQKKQTVSWLYFAETSKTSFSYFPFCLCHFYDQYFIFLTINRMENIGVYYKAELLDIDIQGIELVVQNGIP